MHSSLHFALGVWCGICLLLPRIFKALRANSRLAEPIGQLILASYALGAVAIVPNLLRQMGCPEEVCASPLMNIFLLHPLFDKIYAGGMLIGETTILTAFTLQYMLMLVAIRKRHK